MAEIMNIPCMMHSAIEAGILTAASVHLLAGQFNHLEYPSEVTGLHGFASDLVKNLVKIEARAVVGSCISYPRDRTVDYLDVQVIALSVSSLFTRCQA